MLYKLLAGTKSDGQWCDGAEICSRLGFYFRRTKRGKCKCWLCFFLLILTQLFVRWEGFSCVRWSRRRYICVYVELPNSSSFCFQFGIKVLQVLWFKHLFLEVWVGWDHDPTSQLSRRVDWADAICDSSFTQCLVLQDIVTGVKEFRVILEHQPSQTMKAITLYELGVTCSKQHRWALHIFCSILLEIEFDL